MNWTPTHINTINGADLLIWIIGITILRFFTMAPKTTSQVTVKRTTATGDMQRKGNRTISSQSVSTVCRETGTDDNRWARREQMLRKYQRPVASSRRQTASRPVKKAA